MTKKGKIYEIKLPYNVLDSVVKSLIHVFDSEEQVARILVTSINSELDRNIKRIDALYEQYQLHPTPDMLKSIKLEEEKLTKRSKKLDRHIAELAKAYFPEMLDKDGELIKPETVNKTIH